MMHFWRLNVQVLTDAQKARRVQGCTDFLNNRLSSLANLKRAIWSDEKTFELQPRTSNANNVVYTPRHGGDGQLVKKMDVADGRLYVPAATHSLAIHVWCGVTWNDKLGPIFFASNERMNSQTYSDRVLRGCVGSYLNARDADGQEIIDRVGM